MKRLALGVVAAAALGAACASAQEGAPTLFGRAVSTPPPAEAPVPHAGNPPTVFSASEMHWTDTDVGRRTQLTDEASRTIGNLEIHVTTLNPGNSSHAPHRHAQEEVIVLHDGTLEVYVNGETKVIGPGSVMVFLSNDWHAVNNVGNTPATYQVINFHPRN